MADLFYNPIAPDHVPVHLVHDFNMYDPAELGVDLFQSVRNLHDRNLPPVFWTRNNGGHWVVLKSELITDVARDFDRFSSKRMLVPDEQNFEVPFFIPLMSDPPQHTAYRAMCTTFFTPRRVKALRQSVTDLTRELIREMKPNGGCEFMADFAMQMPIIVFLRLVDLPLEDRPALLKIANAIVAPEEGELRGIAMQKMFAYLRPVIAERAANPGDDVLSKVISSPCDGRPLSMDEMMGLAATFLAGGLDTVTAALGYFARHLAENPDSRRDLLEDAGLMTFGSDIHFYVGSFLARMELETFVRYWLEAIPDFTIADGAHIGHHHGINIAYETLPLAWDN